MTTFRHPMALVSKDGSRLQRVIALVGTGSIYSVMPSPLLQMLGIDPEWTWVFEQSDGRQEEYPVAEVRLRLNDQERTTICIFGKPDSGPVVGAYTLEGFGVAADPVSRKLVPARLFLV